MIKRAQINGKKSVYFLEDKNKTALQAIIEDKKSRVISYHELASIIGDDKRLIGKIREESEELIEAFAENDNLVWEAADLIFHTFLILANRNVKWNELSYEFQRRRK